MTRTAEVRRQTRETQVEVAINLDGTGTPTINLRIGLLRHMLECLATHSLFDLCVTATGDLDHHISEDVALCLGQAIREALDDVTGIARFGHAVVPMDCSLAEVALDLSGRPYSVIDLRLNDTNVEGWRSDDIEHFLMSLANTLRANIHARSFYSRDDHHCVEAVFKALGLCLRQATTIDPRRAGIPSSKGMI